MVYLVSHVNVFFPHSYKNIKEEMLVCNIKLIVADYEPENMIEARIYLFKYCIVLSLV